MTRGLLFRLATFPTISASDILADPLPPPPGGSPPDPDAEMPDAPVVPMPPAWFHLLLALTAGERHGYALMQAVADESAGQVRLGPGTLYGALKRLLELRLVEESGRRPDPAMDDERRRYYRLTPAGRRALRAEAARHARLVSLARAKRVLPRPRPA